MRESFGQRLRQQREERRITIAAIATATRIKSSLFHGLERDDVTQWPSGIFRRAFIRAYADAIGLDPDAVCREFVERFPDPAEPPPSPPANVTSPITRHMADWRRMVADRKDSLSTVSEMLEETRVPGTQSCRWRAAFVDTSLLLLLAFVGLAITGRFWAPLAVTALVYHVAGSLLLGKSPALRWFERRAMEEGLADGPSLEPAARSVR